ncbi:MAG: ABC transporter substrate-binding protein [Deltaproteobacteria bacterium]|nr:ABC transporter substrate-binding protein [Deltaproteobacteria bacterium]
MKVWLLLSALWFGLHAAPLSAGEAKAPLKLRVGLGSSPVPPLPNSVLWLAKDLGFYQREGLDIELIEFQGTPLAIAAMISGDIDVGNVSTSEVIRLSATKGAPMRAIHSPDARLYFLIAARDEIKSLQGLAGKTFGVARLGSVDHTQSMLTLKAMGVNPASLTVIAMGVPSTRAQALVAGRIDATSMSVGTWVTIQRESGVRVLVDHNTFFENATVVEKVNAATAKVIEEKPEQLRRFTAAIVKTARHFADNQESWVNAITKRRTKLDRGDAMNLWTTFKSSWAVNGLLNLDIYRKTAEFYYQTASFEKVPRIDVNEWTDTRFLDGVLKETGVFAQIDPLGRQIR